MSLPTEFEIVDKLYVKLKKFGQVNELATVNFKNRDYPIHGFVLGSEDKSAPTFGLFSGVHGLERVGVHVTTNFLMQFLTQMEWNKSLREMMKDVRLVGIPIINPVGTHISRRANGNNVDLMRNADVHDPSQKYLPLVSGHKISPHLPWYQGDPHNMEVETKALIDFVRKEMFPSKFSMSLDVHSGFGMRDRLWYPYSHTRKLPPDELLIQKFIETLDQSLPFNVYKIERQTDSYLINGDPWDFLYIEAHNTLKDRTYIPWCLELGSWTWLRKNPKQFFKRTGLFNPEVLHRYKRIMRRHTNLFDFFLRTSLHHNHWK